MDFHLLSCLGIPFKLIQWLTAQMKWIIPLYNETVFGVLTTPTSCSHKEQTMFETIFVCPWRQSGATQRNISFKHVTEIRHDKREYHPKKLNTMIYYQVNFMASISVQVAKHTFKATFMHGKVVSVTRLLLVWIQHHIFQSMTSTIYFSEVDIVSQILLCIV